MTDKDLPDEITVDDFELPPAVEAHIAMPPALVEAVQEDPELLVQLTRGQLAVVQDRMVSRVMKDPDATIGQLASVHEQLSKNARLKPEAGASSNSAAQVVINFIRAPGKDTLTIDNATGKPVDAPG